MKLRSISGCQLQIWIQLQIHIRVVLFDLNLGFTLAPALVPYMSHYIDIVFNILSHNSIPSGQIWKYPSRTGSVCIRWSFWVPSNLCYLQNWAFCPIFLFISILFPLCLHKPYCFLFKCNYDSLDWQFGTYCFYVDLETSSNIKLICVPNHCYWSVPFSAANSLF